MNDETKAEKERIFLSSPHMGGEELDYIREAFDTNWIAPLGPHVDAFERECAAKIGVKSALALSCGTAAAHLAARLMGLSRDDTFFCSSLTFVATLAPLVQMGAMPTFIDSEPESWNMSPPALARAFKVAKDSGRLPKLVVIVNLYGQSCDMAPIFDICDSYGVPVLEDAAESFGATYNGRQTGSFGKFSFLSFNGNKIITTSGGGMLLSDDADAIAKARFWSTQARDKAPWYQHTELGYNYRMSNVLAGIGRAQLKLLDRRIEERRAVFDRYVAELGDIEGIDFMPEPKWSRSIRWLTCITLDPERCTASPIEVINALAADNIESRPVWKPMHMQPVFDGVQYFEHEPGVDASKGLFERGICLPSGSNMTHEQQERVIACVRHTLA